jgi:hypothetical protein
MSNHNILAALALSGALLIAPGHSAGAVPVSPSLSFADELSTIEFVQDRQKAETVKQKVKRIWRNLTAYKFDVACPAFTFALTRTSCSANGKNREDARAKCQSQYVLCELRDANR